MKKIVIAVVALATAFIISGLGPTPIAQTPCINCSPGPTGPAGGDLSGTYPNPSVVKVNGVSLAGLGTGLLKNTTGTGALSIGVAGTDYAGLASTNLFTGPQSSSYAGTASTPAWLITGTPFAGTTSNSYPQLFFNNGTTPTNFATGGTFLGINCASTSQTALSIWVNGSSNAGITCGGTVSAPISAKTISTQSNCASAASPAVCGSAPAGSVAVAAGTNPTLVVNTTAVTANSEIFLTEDQSLGSRLGVTCNTTLPTGAANVSARSSGTSFTLNVVGVFTTNPVCLSYHIMN